MSALSQGRPALAPLAPHTQAKATSTTQSSSLKAVANNAYTKPDALPQLQPVPPRGRPEASRVDAASLPATLSLIRRVLAPDKTATSVNPRLSPRPIEDILPPLTSSNDIDVQLYAIIAIIVKEFINTWYSNITPDRSFADEVIQVIAHCSRALEERLRRIDVAELFLDEIPALLEQHVATFRTATQASTQGKYSPSTHEIYHVLNPHPALEPVLNDKVQQILQEEQHYNETIYRQLLITSALAVLLPTEDLQNAPLRILVCDIVADLIIGQALAGKVCEGWFIHESITKIATVIHERINPQASGQHMRQEVKPRLEQFGLLSSDDVGNLHYMKIDYQTRLSAWFWRIMQGVYLAILTLRFLLKGINRARHDPERRGTPPPRSGSPASLASMHGSQQLNSSGRPVVQYNVYSALSTLLRVNDRMPWLASAITYSQHVLLYGTGRLAAAHSVLDRFLWMTIRSYLFSASIVPPILLNLRIALFPSNSLAMAGSPSPTPTERLQIRRSAAEALLALLPTLVSSTFFDTSDHDEMVTKIEEDVLMPFDDAYLNKHFVYGVLELIICRLVPELTESSASELLAERGITVEGDDMNVEEE